MKFATLAGPGRDGRLAIVSRDLATAVFSEVPTLQLALENWGEHAPSFERHYRELNEGRAKDAFAFDATQALAPLPRAYQWLDASAFLAHGELMAKAFQMTNAQGAKPLVYQGGSDNLLSGRQDVPFVSEDDGIDFEGEFGVILGDVAMAPSADEIHDAIRLIVLINDWSLRTIAPIEMKTGFGWIQAKPASSFAPIAVTPDELGDVWSDGRIKLPLRVELNGKSFGHPFGGAMNFSFFDLIRHVTATRSLIAGTILGSGTVSEGDPDRVGSACIAERRGFEMIQFGAARTEFLRFGDRVRLGGS
ncbi:fumarylacetoacetate hydrolase family protein [Rhodopseudomonas sp. B29]|uniref:fumarylacetoacetate hydrolase family protein n=1 Tax=Rhodopseudomonas sp. B29 TaxID=95607 RepID=UPI00034CD82D|nr:fumarylacetoacetate hydrolase family protein [Rhodopseudomonas sp. B29]